MASYPGAVRAWTTKTNVVDLIDASHPNTLQDEVAAIQTTLGVNPHVSTAPNPAGTFVVVSTTFATLAARLANIETGIVADSHNQYQHLAGGDTMYGSADGVVVHRIRARPTQTGALARIESNDQTTAYFQVTTGGVAMSAATVAGSPVVTTATLPPAQPLSDNAPTASAAGDTASSGTGTTASRDDHRHARESFGAVTSQTAYGAAAANGSAVTLARSDHAHGTPALTATAPGGSAVGDTAAVGTGTAPAREDHRHAREGFGAVTTQTSFGAAAANGTAVSVARSDHAHGTPAVPSKTVRMPHTFVVSGDVLLPSGDTNYIPPFYVPVPAGQTVTFAKAVMRVNSGTSVTFNVTKAGTSFATGLSAVSAGGSSTTGAGTAFADNDQCAVVVTAVSGSPKNMTITLYFDYAH